MNKTALRSIVIGAAVFVISMVLPYLGHGDFLWFTVKGDYFDESELLYLVSPAAMPVLLILWLLGIYGLAVGYFARKAGEASDRFSNAGIVIGIVNILLLGWQTMILPLLSWIIWDRPVHL